MLPYIVCQGDFLAKVAARLGFDAEVVWKDEKNADLRAQRDNPDQLVTGDVLYVPEPTRKWLPLKVGATNAFAAPRPKVKIHLRFVAEGKALANEKYAIEGEDLKGTTDGDGCIECEIALTTAAVRVRFIERREIYTAHVGHLDPASEPSGARQRLAALGAFGRASAARVAMTAISEEALADALRVFQRTNKLDVTGELDEATRAKLVDLHGS